METQDIAASCPLGPIDHATMERAKSILGKLGKRARRIMTKDSDFRVWSHDPGAGSREAGLAAMRACYRAGLVQQDRPNGGERTLLGWAVLLVARQVQR